MLECYTFSLLSLSLTLVIIIIITIIIIIISSIINVILEEKEKATGCEGGFTNKTVWTCLYACYLCPNLFFCLFCFLAVSFKTFLFLLECTIVFINLTKIKINVYFKNIYLSQQAISNTL